MTLPSYVTFIQKNLHVSSLEMRVTSLETNFHLWEIKVNFSKGTIQIKRLRVLYRILPFSLVLEEMFCIIQTFHQTLYSSAIPITFREFSSVLSLSRIRLFATPWTAARQASLSITNSWSLLKLMSID